MVCSAFSVRNWLFCCAQHLGGIHEHSLSISPLEMDFISIALGLCFFLVGGLLRLPADPIFNVYSSVLLRRAGHNDIRPQVFAVILSCNFTDRVGLPSATRDSQFISLLLASRWCRETAIGAFSSLSEVSQVNLYSQTGLLR